ncbi:hypothetical protein, partial [Accumulibacter sp.]|uniref:hypothetical protein n=1 Tax=Accumulibacter sp. TaxID=2053492 RepID=UPI00262CF0B0
SWLPSATNANVLASAGWRAQRPVDGPDALSPAAAGPGFWPAPAGEFVYCFGTDVQAHQPQ